VCTIDFSGTLVVFDGTFQYSVGSGLLSSRVVEQGACAIQDSPADPISLRGIPAGTVANSPRAALALACGSADSTVGSIVRVLSVLPDGSVGTATVVQQASVTAIAVGDVNGDGAGPEVVVAGPSTTLAVYTMPAGGAWVRGASVATGAQATQVVTLMELVDLNGDGR
jgi:hypothetical protein